MSRLNDLIAELCPHGVEFKRLGEVVTISKGVQFNKSDMQNRGSFPVINGGINPSGYIEKYNQSENTVTISQGGASAGYVNWLSTKFWAGAHCYVVKPSDNVINRYVFHFLKSKEKTLQECQYGAGIPALSKATVENLKIPVPPLEVQREIVCILDTFTELTAELTARKKQYEYYRDLLLMFDDSTSFKTISSVADSFTGLTYKPTDKSDTGVLVLRSSNIKNSRLAFDDCVFVNMSKIPERTLAKEGDILICVRNGSKELIGKSALIPHTEEQMAFGAFMTVLRAKSGINQKFLFYIWQSPIVQNKFQSDNAMPINQITKADFNLIKIPVPPLEEQERIVKILDRFDKLCNDLSAGLPAEIAARQKQYEYYRDKLLTFKEAN